MSLYGILDFSLWQVVVAELALTHVTIVTVTVFLHRLQAHRALDLHPAASHFFRFWLWLTTGMVTREWVAMHRRHHAKCETPGDPHSPRMLGLGKALTQGAELYGKAAGDPQTLIQYGRGTPDDWIERRLYSPVHLVGGRADADPGPAAVRRLRHYPVGGSDDVDPVVLNM